MIEVRHLKKQYADVTPITDLNCVINEGDVVAIIGPSGCGKSTFIRCLNLMEKPTSGEILFDGKNILNGEMKLTDVRKYAGMIFQGFYLYPQYTVLENIMVPQIDILKRTKQEAYDKAVENLKMVDLFAAINKYPDQLSGGQKQRVAIARTLAMDNKVILMDEPTSALDPIMVREVQYVIRKLAKAGKTMLIVTHEMRLAREIANRVFFINGGVLYEEGTPEQFFTNPQREATRNFINCVNEKVLSIEKSAFEYISCVTEIEHFAERNDLSDTLTQALIAVFEELTAATLLPQLPNDGRVQYVLGYSELNRTVQITVKFTGIRKNPLDACDPLSLSILNHHCETMNYQPCGDEEWDGRLDVALSPSR